jgi:hypothetical protein
VEDIELALAPVIYSCARANERQLRFRRLLLMILVAYGVILSFSVLVAAFAALVEKGRL